MMRRPLIGILLLLAAFTLTELLSAASARNASHTVASAAQTRAQQRKAIQEMPLLSRPDRVGHFYGNTVRHAYQRRHGG